MAEWIDEIMGVRTAASYKPKMMTVLELSDEELDSEIRRVDRKLADLLDAVIIQSNAQIAIDEAEQQLNMFVMARRLRELEARLGDRPPALPDTQIYEATFKRLGTLDNAFSAHIVGATWYRVLRVFNGESFLHRNERGTAIAKSAVIAISTNPELRDRFSSYLGVGPRHLEVIDYVVVQLQSSAAAS